MISVCYIVVDWEIKKAWMQDLFLQMIQIIFFFS